MRAVVATRLLQNLVLLVFIISGEFVDTCHAELIVCISLLISELSMLDTCIDALDNR